MFETDLRQAHPVPYEALSYVWGKEKSTDKIRVDGYPFTVTENLYQALSNLRRSGEDRVLWVDAICINQSNHWVSDKLNTRCSHPSAPKLILYVMGKSNYRTMNKSSLLTIV